jgi:hypothetical protein
LPAIRQRLASPRTRYSLRNWVWMIVKNVSWRQEMAADLFITGRLAVFFILSLLHPPLLKVWVEIARGLPIMFAKREAA